MVTSMVMVTSTPLGITLPGKLRGSFIKNRKRCEHDGGQGWDSQSHQAL